MKKIIVIAIFFLNLIGYAQIKGNKTIITKTFNLDKIEVVKINIYAKVSIDCDSENRITIKTDENLLKHIDKKVENGILDLNQLEWIQASQKMEIIIGAPYLKEVETGTHDITIVENFKNNALKIVSSIGNIKVSGKTNYLIIDAKNGTIDASKLITENAKITITGRSKTKVNVLNKLEKTLSDDARFILVNTPKTVLGDTEKLDKKSNSGNDIQWINIRIKNNSLTTSKFVVVGPKQDGSQFSYGFSIFPSLTKNERWTVGSKIYRETTNGLKELLVTISESDKDKTIKLFQ